ncbi:MAG TPA: SigB/SigF/SigG family RNA polymerase sigma factor [Solirubrobacteraceae bacterium]|nr:SigB/SigF/SigG family RNA polymerase sigma factor [Solirubrobacteraceae bacterium]
MTNSALDDSELWHRRADDPAAREELVRRHLPLARRLAARYRNRHEPLEDLVQVASLALVKAVERFEPERGRPFVAFAAPTILGELKRHFRDTSWAAHVNRGALELALQVQGAVEELSRQTGRSPSVADLAVHLELDAERVLEGLEAGAAHYADSLDVAAPGADDDDARAATVLDHLGSEDAGYEEVEMRGSLGPALARLPHAERQALALRLDHGLKQSEIAARLGCSQMHVSRLLRRAGERLRAELDPQLGGAVDPEPSGELDRDGGPGPGPERG